MIVGTVHCIQMCALWNILLYELWKSDAIASVYYDSLASRTGVDNRVSSTRKVDTLITWSWNVLYAARWHIPILVSNVV